MKTLKPGTQVIRIALEWANRHLENLENQHQNGNGEYPIREELERLRRFILSAEEVHMDLNAHLQKIASSESDSSKS